MPTETYLPNRRIKLNPNNRKWTKAWPHLAWSLPPIRINPTLLTILSLRTFPNENDLNLSPIRILIRLKNRQFLRKMYSKHPLRNRNRCRNVLELGPHHEQDNSPWNRKNARKPAAALKLQNQPRRKKWKNQHQPAAVVVLASEPSPNRRRSLRPSPS